MICEICRQSAMEAAVESFGHLLSVRRRLLGLSMGTIAQRAGLGKDYICRIERNELINVTIPNMLRLSNAYGIDFQEMCELYADQNEAYERGFEIERRELYKERANKRKAEKDETRHREEARNIKRTEMDNGRGPRPDVIPPHIRKNLNSAKEPQPEPPISEGDLG